MTILPKSSSGTNLLADLRRRVSSSHSDGPHARDQSRSKLESFFRQIRENDRRSSCGVSSEESDESDRTGTADEEGVSESDCAAFECGESDDEGLEEGAFFVRDRVWQSVEPFDGVEVVTGESTVVRRSRKEDNVRASVLRKRISISATSMIVRTYVFTNSTQLAIPTRNSSLHRNSVSNAPLVHIDSWTQFDDLSR